MKLNRVEKALMNNPVRALVQRRHEAALMERFGGHVEGGHHDRCRILGARGALSVYMMVDSVTSRTGPDPIRWTV